MPEAQRIKREVKPRRYGRVAFDLPAARADEAGAIIVALGALGCESAKLPETGRCAVANTAGSTSHRLVRRNQSGSLEPHR